MCRRAARDHAENRQFGYFRGRGLKLVTLHGHVYPVRIPDHTLGISAVQGWRPTRRLGLGNGGLWVWFLADSRARLRRLGQGVESDSYEGSSAACDAAKHQQSLGGA